MRLVVAVIGFQTLVIVGAVFYIGRPPLEGVGNAACFGIIIPDSIAGIIVADTIAGNVYIIRRQYAGQQEGMCISRYFVFTEIAIFPIGITSSVGCAVIVPGKTGFFVTLLA